MARSGRITIFGHSLVGRLMIGVALINVILISVLAWSVFRIVHQYHEEQFVANARMNSSMFAGLVAARKSFKDTRLLFEDAVYSDYVVYAEVLDAKGKEIIKIVDQPGKRLFKEDFFFDRNNDNTYYISLPLSSRTGEQWGTLRLGYSETDTEEQIEQIFRRGLYISLAFLILNTLLVLFWGRRIVRPLQKLRHAARNVATGSLNEKLAVDSNITEIVNLAEDLNRMRAGLVKQADTLKHQASHDALTGLPNRLLLTSRMEYLISISSRSKDPFTFMLMDLDGFKEINDTLGHLAGDLLLQQIATRLNYAVRESDTVARLGGDEFAIVFPKASEEIIDVVTGKVLSVLEQPFCIDNHPIQVGASIGVALYPEHGLEGTDLLRHADIAMYEAKRKGGGYELYHDGLRRDALDQLTLAGELKRAIDEDQLVVFYQPKINLKTNQLCGAEALIRWNHPERGLVPPDDFISIAERTNLIGPLTHWMVAAALQQLKRWHESGLMLDLSVNLSVRNLQEKELPQRLAQVLASIGIDPRHLQIELTESVIMEDPVRADTVFRLLHEQGIGLSIDDFGTGYSSLVHLKQLPVSEIKIDRCFVKDMVSNESDAAIVRATIDLGHALGMRVVAEGVEDESSLKLLHTMGCDIAQGYYFRPPVPADEFENWCYQTPWYSADKAVGGGN